MAMTGELNQVRESWQKSLWQAGNRYRSVRSDTAGLFDWPVLGLSKDSLSTRGAITQTTKV